MIAGPPSNVRPTTLECVHLVTRGHFRSLDNDGGHTIRSAIAKNPMLYSNFTALRQNFALFDPFPCEKKGRGGRDVSSNYC